MCKLSLNGLNMRYENLTASNQDLTFDTFQSWCQDEIGLETLSQDTFKTFQIYTDQKGFTNMALLLSDQNCFPGVDIVQFGENHSEIQSRRILKDCSVLEIYEQACECCENRYSYEKVEEFSRKLYFRIPPEAFREALANALVHRKWDGADYLNRQISVPRNQNLAIIFNRLGLIEKFGTGISRIRKSYQNSVEKPFFDILDQFITVRLPIVHKVSQLDPGERVVLQMIKSGVSRRQELNERLEYSDYRLTKILKKLQKKRLIVKKGSTRNDIFVPSDL